MDALDWFRLPRTASCDSGTTSGPSLLKQAQDCLHTHLASQILCNGCRVNPD